MATLGEALAHALYILFRIPDTYVHKPDDESTRARDFHCFEVTAAGERCLDAKALVGPEIFAGSPNYFSSCRYRGAAGVCGIDPFSDRIGVQEILSSLILEPACESAFSGSVWSR